MNHIKQQLEQVIAEMRESIIILYSIKNEVLAALINKYVDHLSAIVEQMEKVEPVAWVNPVALEQVKEFDCVQILFYRRGHNHSPGDTGRIPLYAAPQVPACRIALPKVTDEIWEDYNETDLLTWKDGAPHWTQLAVDFACLLKGWCIERLSESPQVPDGMVLVGTVIKPSGGIDYIRWNVVYESIPAGTKLYAQIAAAKEEGSAS